MFILIGLNAFHGVLYVFGCGLVEKMGRMFLSFSVYSTASPLLYYSCIIGVHE